LLDYNQFEQELKTVRDFIRFAMSEFERHELYFGHGTNSSFDEALALVTYIIACPYEHLEFVLDSRLCVFEKKKVFELLKKRVNERIPLPYLTKQANFCGLPFYVDENVLIPRSPIAELIENHFAPWLTSEPKHILELCTGSGCIAVALAYAFEDAEVVASDVSEAALKIANKNVAKHRLQDQVRLVKSDLFDNVPKNRFDLIVSNPPYVSETEMQTLPKEYNHEPRLALHAEDEGLALVDKMLVQAKEYLSDEGVMVVEVGNSQKTLVSKYPNIPFTWLEFERGGDGVFLLTREELELI
jgi:ribosomal protein L3 glutamine methyltransferase